MLGNLNDIEKELQTHFENGLTSSQVEEKKLIHGFNRFEEEKKETILQKILLHLQDVTLIILLVAAALAFYLAIQEGHGYADAIVILAIVVFGMFLAIKQELGAEKSLEALKKMNAPKATVIRDGVTISVEAEELVPGDIILIETGDMIPADARLIECANLKVEESALTGESVPVGKDSKADIKIGVAIGDQLNMLFSGCLVTNGRAKAVVTETGMNTEMGKIAGLLNKTKKTKTPLQQRLDKLGKNLCVVAVCAAGIMFGFQFLNGEPILETLMNAVALAVAVVPEALPIVVVVTLIYGVHNMAQKQAIIRKIPAVETLGSTSVICSDKTGTLTMNKMTVVTTWVPGYEPLNIDGDVKSTANDQQRLLIEMFGLNCNAVVEFKNGEETEIGDPTETALVRLLAAIGKTRDELEEKLPRVFEIPFDSGRKLMTTVHQMEDGRYLSITKGAFDRIPAGFDDSAREMHDAFARKALRCLAIGYKYYDDLPDEMTVCELESDLIFGGLVGMIDPPRPESIIAVRTAKEAGIRTIMITGDHIDTATAIAKEIGIYTEGQDVISGAMLDQMSDDELFHNVKNISVYARVSPECKLRIVQAWQRCGEVVAMTGDGVNDAPALKAANVGVAMGSGTEVSKNASDMILTDDNFASIVSAVAEGRRAYDNIRKVIISLLSCNISEIFTMLIAIIAGWGAPVTAIQLLFINTVADGVPDLCMCREKMEVDTMKRPPVDKDAGVLKGILSKIGIMTVLFAVTSLFGYYAGQFMNISETVPASQTVGRTMAYLIIGLSSVVNILNVRSHKMSLFKLGITSNRLLFFGICFSLTALISTATIPVLMGIFHCVPLAAEHWLMVIGLSVLPIPVSEIHKWKLRRAQ